MGFLSPSPPKPPKPVVVQPEPEPILMEPVEEDVPDVEERDISQVDRARRRRLQPSLLDLLSDSSQSPTIL